MNELNVFYICDEGFAEVAAASITSLFSHNPSNALRLTVYVLLANAGTGTRRRLVSLGERFGQTVRPVDADAALHELEALDLASYRGSSVTNLRLYFDKLLPRDIHRILYLDADTLVLDDLSPLCSLSLHGRMLGMVLDAYGDLMRGTRGKPTAPYYNAGVLLIDCDRWRRQNWRQRITRYIDQNGAPFAHPDQDIYNLVCRDEICRLPIRYNLQTVHRAVSDRVYFRFLSHSGYYSPQEIAAARECPAVIHMIRTLGTNPWNTDGALHPDSALYRQYKALTPWAGEAPRPGNADFLIQTERFLHRFLPQPLMFPLTLAAIWTAQKLNAQY